MRMALLAIFLVLGAGGAQADNCGKSRDYLFGNVGDLTLPPKAYEDLFRVCMAAAAMSNIRDAYILKDGGIAVIAKQDSVAATATTPAIARTPGPGLRITTEISRSGGSRPFPQLVE